MKKHVLVLVGTLLVLSGVPYSVFAKHDKARVLVVHSYSESHVCGAPQATGVFQALAERGWTKGRNLEVQSVFMDTKKTFTTPDAIREQGRLALSRVAVFKPDVVVVLDDNAIREVMLPLIGRKDLSVVFSGMNGQPLEYDKKIEFIDRLDRPGNNVTGVYEKLHAAKSLVVLNAALSDSPAGNKVVGITDFSPTGNAITRQFELELEKFQGPLEWSLRRVRDFEEYKTLIRELNEEPGVKAIYPAALSLATADGATYTAGEIFAWTIANSRKPEMALNYYFSKIGLFGGAAVDFTSMGRTAGEKVARILNGEKAGEIPIEDAPDYAIVFNLERARVLGIDIPEPLLTAADHVYQEIPRLTRAGQ